jgi:hypothetical protein
LESNCDEHIDIEYTKLFLSVLNTFALCKTLLIIAHSREINEILAEKLTDLNKKLILLLLEDCHRDNHFYEALLRVLRTFSVNNIFICGGYEEFVTNIDKFLINDECTQYILSNIRII